MKTQKELVKMAISLYHTYKCCTHHDHSNMYCSNALHLFSYIFNIPIKILAKELKIEGWEGENYSITNEGIPSFDTAKIAIEHIHSKDYLHILPKSPSPLLKGKRIFI